MIDFLKDCCLRPVADDDLDLMLLWRNSKHVRENMFHSNIISNKEHFEWWKKAKEDTTSDYLLFECSGSPLGIIYFNDINKICRTGFWGFYKGINAPDGTGNRMLFYSLDYAFNKLKLRKLNSEILAYNVRSLSIHKKMGFKVEGIFIRHHKTENGYTDVYRMAIFSEEWANTKHLLINKIEGYHTS